MQILFMEAYYSGIFRSLVPHFTNYLTTDAEQVNINAIDSIKKGVY